MSILKAALLPPFSFFLLALLSVVIRRRFRRTGRLMIVVAILGMVTSSLPIFGTMSLRTLQSFPAHQTHERSEAQAIVVLGADLRPNAPDYSGDTLSILSLERVRYAARIAKRIQRPVCCCGGVIREGTRAVGEILAEVLETEHGVAVKWQENRSQTTWENARFAAADLQEQDITKIALVTHAWHMPRAKRAFEHFGFEVIPAPTGFEGKVELDWRQFVPSARAMTKTALAVHEWVGRGWYEVKISLD